MPYTSKLQFKAGGTIAGPNSVRPGAQIKKAVDEIQRKSITDLKSAVPGLGFRKSGSNTWTLVSKDDGGGEGILRPGKITNNGSSGSADIRYEGGIYYLDIDFPRVNRTTSVEIQSGET